MSAEKPQGSSVLIVGKKIENPPTLIGTSECIIKAAAFKRIGYTESRTF